MTQENNAAPEEVLKLDYSIEDPQARNELVHKIINNTPSEKLTPLYLEILTKYLLFPINKEERKQRKILTDNRMVTINKRETSYEGLLTKFENGEDGIYNLIINDKNVILTPKVQITEKDIQEIPGLKELRESIEQVELQAKLATGRRKFLLKKQAIEMRKDQYVLKSSFRHPIYSTNLVKSFVYSNLYENITINADGSLSVDAFCSLLVPQHVSVLLCNYSKIKEDSWGKFSSDAYYLMMDLENLADKVLKERFPLYYKLMIYKIDGKTNEEIQRLLFEEFEIKHSVEYLSSLWRKKIPKLLADQAQKDYLIWYYTSVEKGKWKKCSRCGQVKLAHNMFFSKNKTSKDGYYSICKDCRNKKKG